MFVKVYACLANDTDVFSTRNVSTTASHENTFNCRKFQKSL